MRTLVDKYDSLDNFTNRMRVFHKFIRIIEGVAFKHSFKDRFQIDRDLLYQLIMLVLVFFLEENSKQGYTEMQNIKGFLSEVLDEIQTDEIRLERQRDDKYDIALASFIINDILRNGGSEIMPLKIYNFNSQKEETLPISYIEGVQGSTSKLKLTKEGYSLLFLTYEITKDLDSKTESLILNYKLKRSDFKDVKMRLNRIIIFLRGEISDIDRYIEEINKDAHFLDGDVEKMRDRVNDLCIVKKKDLQLLKLRDLAEDAFRTVEYYDENQEEAKKLDKVSVESKRRDIKLILNYINDTLSLFQKLSEKANDLAVAKEEALKRAMMRWKKVERISLKRDLTDKVFRDTDTIPRIDQLILPFFTKSMDKHFPIERILEEHIYVEEDDSKNLLVDIKQQETVEEEERLKEEIQKALEEERKKYMDKLVNILAEYAYILDGRTSVGEILKELTNEDSNFIKSNINLFKLFLVKLAEVGRYKTFEYGDISFDTEYLNTEVCISAYKDERGIELRFTDIALILKNKGDD